MIKSKGCVSHRAPTAAVNPHGARALTFTLLASRRARGCRAGWGHVWREHQGVADSTAQLEWQEIELGDGQGRRKEPSQGQAPTQR